MVITHVRSHHQRNSQEIDTVRLVSESVMLVTLYRKTTWKAGQSFFLTLPTVSSFPLETHPFTVAALPGPFGTRPVLIDGTKELLFIIRAKDGFTRRLLNLAKAAGGRAAQLPLTLVDGPYGVPPDVDAFRHVVLIAGEFKLNI